ncbi:MAG: amidohydrolase family protein [Nocardioides sp.]|uniref:amidohydrolase family protein n=1 Tax=Nocardioides sp. TaxID=35761 RepID=UPI003F07A076
MLLTGGTVLAGADWVPEAADVLVVDGVVAALEPHGSFDHVDAERVDASRRLVTAGLVNGHTHSQALHARGVNRDWTLETSLLHGGWLSAPRTAELARLSALLCGVELLGSGCTGAFDLVAQSPLPDVEGLSAVAEGYAAAGVRAVLAPMVADRSVHEAVPVIGECCGVPGSAATAAELVALSARWASTARPAGVQAAVAPTIPAHCTPELVAGLHRVAVEHDLRVHLHLAESVPQAVSGRERFGRSITAELAAQGVLDGRLTVAHALWVDGADRELLAEAGAVAVTVPGSNLRLGSGVADIRGLLSAGVRLAVGTDGANSADRMDQLDAARLAALLSRVSGGGPPSWLTPEETLSAASAGGAAACGWSDVGVLAPGYAADLVLWDLDAPAFWPVNDLTNQLVTAGRAADVRDVYVGGRPVLAGGAPVGVDVAGARGRFLELVEELHGGALPLRESAAAQAAACAASLAELVSTHSPRTGVR